MTYRLEFVSSALKEWEKLDGSTRTQFRKKMAERLGNARVPNAALHGAWDRYKIKLRDVGYRLVYEVQDRTVTVTVIAVGHVYDIAAKR